MGGLIDTAYVRIRMISSSGEAVAGVKAGLKEIQTEVQASARANVSSTRMELQANTVLAGSYKDIAASAVAASNEQVAASDAAGEAAVVNSKRMVASSDAAAVAAERVKGKFLDLGKALGIGFGVVEFVKFTKDVTGSAASVQKSIEVIKNSFGPDASKVITGFGDSVAGTLGISAEAADTFAARMGILLHNLQIAPEVGSKITVNFIKLAGALAQIKGVDPGTALNQLDRALLGNTRGLKSLGLAIDPTQEKLVALQLGLIKTGEALTPTARAEAIYVLATAQLPHYLSLAAQHTGDLATVQQHLRAEWSNTKDIIGTGLLPAFSKYVGEIGAYLDKANKTGQTQRDVNTAMRDGKQIVEGIKEAFDVLFPPVHAVVGALGGLKTAIRDVGIAWALIKVNSMVTGLLNIGRAAGAAGAAGDVGLLASKWRALAGLGPVVLTAYVATQFLPQNKNPSSIERKINSIPFTGRISSATEAGLNAAFGSGIKAAQSPTPPAALDAALKAKVAQDFANGVSGGFSKVWGSPDLLNMPEAVTALKKVGSDAAAGFNSGLTNGIVQGTGNNGNAAASLAKANAAAAAQVAAQTRAAAAQAAQQEAAAVAAAKEGIAQLKSNLQQSIKQTAQDLNDAILSAKQNLISVGTSLANDITAAIDAPFDVAQQRIQFQQDKLQLQYDVKAAKLQAQVAAVNALQARVGLHSDENTLARLRAEVLLPGGKTLASNPDAAIKQLQALAAKSPVNRFSINDFITQFEQASSAVTLDKLGIKQNALSTGLTKAQTPLNLRSETLKIAKEAADLRAQAVTRQIADLTAELNSGSLGLVSFNKRVAKLLEKDAPSYKEAGKVLGKAFRLQYQSEVGELLAQAKAITAAPHRAGTGQETKVVRPLETLEKGQHEVASLHRQIGKAQTALQTRIAKATERAAKAAEVANTRAAKQRVKDAAAVAAAKSVHIGATASDVNPGIQSSTTKALSGSSH